MTDDFKGNMVLTITLFNIYPLDNLQHGMCKRICDVEDHYKLSNIKVTTAAHKAKLR